MAIGEGKHKNIIEHGGVNCAYCHGFRDGRNEAIDEAIAKIEFYENNSDIKPLTQLKSALIAMKKETKT